jgi:hypothetical protein
MSCSSLLFILVNVPLLFRGEIDLRGNLPRNLPYCSFKACREIKRFHIRQVKEAKRDGTLEKWHFEKHPLELEEGAYSLINQDQDISWIEAQLEYSIQAEKEDKE